DELDVRLLQPGPEARQDLFGRLPQVELAALRVAAVDRHLFERLDQLAGALQIGDELVGGLAVAVDEFDEARTPHLPLVQLAGEGFAAARERRGDRHADADGIVDLVGNAGNETAEGGELLRLDQALLRVAQVGESLFGALLGGPELLFGLAL